MLRHNTTSSSDTQTGGVVDTLESRVSIQKDLNKLEEQASRNLMKFNKGKCKVMHRGQKYPMHQVRLRAEQTTPQLEFGACRTTATDNLERLQRRAAKTVRGPEHLMYKERLRQLVCLAQRREGQEGI